MNQGEAQRQIDDVAGRGFGALRFGVSPTATQLPAVCTEDMPQRYNFFDSVGRIRDDCLDARLIGKFECNGMPARPYSDLPQQYKVSYRESLTHLKAGMT